jgi:hypothetical protein
MRPRFGGYLVDAWLAGIISDLLLQADPEPRRTP